MVYRRMNIVVLAGGISTERDVSLVSGKCIYEALKKSGHKVILTDVYTGLDGKYAGRDATELFDADIDWAEGIRAVADTAPDMDEIKNGRPDGYTGYFGPRVIELCRACDVVFIGLHGADGEDGKVQAYLELEGIAYTGTDHISSALCMDKQLSKDVLGYNGIPVPKGRILHKGTETANTMGYPCVVKVCNGGSSVGVSICHDEAQYAQGLETAFRLDDTVIVEEYIKGREFSVCVTDWDGTPKAMPVIEIAPREEFYDYKSKYQAGATIETCPAKLPDNKSGEMLSLAERGFEALKLRSYARLDFLMDENDGRLYCLEANTLPGMTPTSLVPQEAGACGMSFEELCNKIVEAALV